MRMSDLIDRQELKNKLKRWDECDPYEFVEIAFHAVDDAPTIDAVPVVRCGECKHCYAEGFVHEHNVCEKHPELNDIPDGWFCADGERREG